MGIKSDSQPTLPCFPILGEWRFRHWQTVGEKVSDTHNFASKVWDTQLTDFQELCLQRKKSAQRETRCQSLKSYQPWSSASLIYLKGTRRQLPDLTMW